MSQVLRARRTGVKKEPSVKLRILLLFALLLAMAFPAMGVLSAYAKDPGTLWRPLRIGAGGWLTGIDVAPDGTMVVRADTYGAYIWNGARWAQLVTKASMPAALAQIDVNQGVYEIQIAPAIPVSSI